MSKAADKSKSVSAVTFPVSMFSDVSLWTFNRNYFLEKLWQFMWTFKRQDTTFVMP